MVTLRTLDTSIISFIIMTIILIHSYNRLDRIFVQYKLYISLVILNLLLIIIDILGWAFNGLPGMLNYLYNTGFNLLLYIIVPMAPSLWVLYTYYLVYQDEQKISKIRNVLITFLAVNAVISIISLKTGWFFFVDSANIYHRGSLFYAHLAYCGILIGYSFGFVLTKRLHFQKRQFYSILLFFVPQIVGTTLQAIYYGVSYNWTGMMISMLIIYLNFQSRESNTDYLTGANNRLHLESYIRAKIRNCTDRKTFGAIMVDIDDFKTINDKFGHAIGDEALKNTVQILRNSLRRDDFIARFSGDEFIVIVDTQTVDALINAVMRINSHLKEFNNISDHPYRLSFSMGYSIYDVKAKVKYADYMILIDRLMYANKKNKLTGDDAVQIDREIVN